MGKAKIRPLATPKPIYRSSQKLAYVIRSWTAPGMQNFVAIVLGVFALQIRDFDVLQRVTIIFNPFLGFLQFATAYTTSELSLNLIENLSIRLDFKIKF